MSILRMMSPPGIGFWIVGAFLCFLIALGVLAFGFDRLRSIIFRKNLGGASTFSTQLLRTLPASPLLAIDCSTDLSLASFSDAISQHCEEVFTAFLTGDALNVAVQGISLATDRAAIVYEFSHEALALCRQGKAHIARHAGTGKYLPYIQDQTGQIVEQAKGIVSRGARLAQVASLIVTAAHIVSGVDVVRRMEKLERAMEYLVAERLMEKEARLRRIIQEARSYSQRGLTRDALSALVKMRYDLRELREHLGLEIAYHMKQLEELPDRHTFHYTSWWRRENRETKAITDYAIAQRKQEMTSIALLVDALLALHTGTIDDLRDHSLPRDASQWAALQDASATAEARFRRENPKREFDAMRGRILLHVNLIDQISPRAVFTVY